MKPWNRLRPRGRGGFKPKTKTSAASAGMDSAREGGADLSFIGSTNFSLLADSAREGGADLSVLHRKDHQPVADSAREGGADLSDMSASQISGIGDSAREGGADLSLNLSDLR